MMENFAYAQTEPRYIFGKGKIDQLADEIKPYSNRILLVYGSEHLKKTGGYERITTILHKNAIAWTDLPGVHSNPRVDVVRRGIEICRENNIEFVLGIGGGSTSDSAKAIAAGVKLDQGDVWNAYEDFHRRVPDEQKKFLIRDSLPFGVVMTKAGTGSDFDCTSVLSNWDSHEKLMTIYPALFPRFSLCDPELSYDLPADQTAYGVADMMTHIFEQYFSHTSNTPALDQIKEGLLKTMITCGPVALQEPDNYDARANLMFCASWACSQMAGSGVITDWASHLIEHEVTAITDLNHGLGMAIIYPGWMQVALPHGPEKFAQYGERVWGITRGNRTPEAVGEEAIEKTCDFWKSMGIPLTLSEAGVKRDIIPRAAKQAVRFGPIGAYCSLAEQDVADILNRVAA